MESSSSLRLDPRRRLMQSWFNLVDEGFNGFIDHAIVSLANQLGAENVMEKAGASTRPSLAKYTVPTHAHTHVVTWVFR